MGTDASPSRATSPIVVAVGGTRRCTDVLETAAALATSIGSDLEVVLVEDANLIRLADLPVTREIDRASGSARELDRSRLERALHGEERRLRHALTRIRRQSSIRSTVRVVRGRILDEALAASASVEVTFVHDARGALPGERLSGMRLQSRSIRPGLGTQRLSRPAKPVWTLFEGGPASMRVLRVAARLSQVLECGLMVLIPHRGADEAETRKREARAAVDQIDLRFVEVAENRSLLCERTLTPRASSLLVLARQSGEVEDDAMIDYLESIAVPLVLVA